MRTRVPATAQRRSPADERNLGLRAIGGDEQKYRRREPGSRPTGARSPRRASGLPLEPLVEETRAGRTKPVGRDPVQLYRLRDLRFVPDEDAVGDELSSPLFVRLSQLATQTPVGIPGGARSSAGRPLPIRDGRSTRRGRRPAPARAGTARSAGWTGSSPPAARRAGSPARRAPRRSPSRGGERRAS